MEQKYKDKAQRVLEQAQGLLAMDGYLTPVVFAIEDEEMTTIGMNVSSPEEKKQSAQLMKEIAHTDNTEAMIFVLDTYMLELPKETQMSNIPESIKNHEESTTAIIVFLYTKDKTLVRKMPYIKKDNGGYNFFDLGWEDASDIEGRFSNPFND